MDVDDNGRNQQQRSRSVIVHASSVQKSKRKDEDAFFCDKDAEETIRAVDGYLSLAVVLLLLFYMYSLISFVLVVVRRTGRKCL